MQWTMVFLTWLAGAIVAVQSPINASLGKKIGGIEATTVSFVVGLLLAIILTFTIGKGNLRELTQVKFWELTGGLLGVVFVTCMLLAVPKIGVATAMIATFTGQLMMGFVVDHFGWFGVPAQPFDLKRAMSVPALALGVWLMKR